MIIALGIDLIEISRIEEVFARQGERFRRRVFTRDEIEYCEARASRFASYAARFAAKEAAMKALGTGWADGISWHDIEVVRNGRGAPSLRLSGRALVRLSEMGATRVHLSLTHSTDLAMAQVIIESDE
ncbi:MAG TPA: holo-ACP synthase [Blastocatellia bacterium]|nr:holo-ACP synthase [Blastocatellia bacterium]